MEKTTLNLFYHRGRLCIGIHFPRNPQLQRIIQKNADAKWSRTNTCWYIEASSDNVRNDGLLRAKPDQYLLVYRGKQGKLFKPQKINRREQLRN